MTLAPAIPSIIHQIKFIRFYVGNPCDVPFLFYIETSLPIVGEIAVKLLQFDLFQFVKTIFKPKWMRSGRHTRRGARGKKRRGGIPEVADMVADTLDPDGTMKIKRWPVAGGVLIEISETVERAFWTMFLIEVIEGLIINTIIGVIETDTKGCPGIGRFLRTDDSETSGGAGGPIHQINVSTIKYSNKVTSSNGHTCTALEGKYALIFAAHIEALNDNMNVKWRLQQVAPEEKTLVESYNYELNDGDTSTVNISATMEEGTSVQWQMVSNSGFIRHTDLRAFAVQIGE